MTNGIKSSNLLTMTPANIKDRMLNDGKLAIDRLLERKRKVNSFVVISDNGKVVKVDAKSLII